MQRRQILTSGLSLVAGGLGGKAVLAAEPMRIGVVYLAPPGDAGWIYAHELSVRSVEKHFGASVKVTRVDNVPETAEAERVFRQLATQGHRVIIGTSFGYMNAMLKVAKDFPKVTFLHSSGYKQATNLSSFGVNLFEGAYLAGGLAASVTKSKTLGFIGAIPIPDVYRSLNAFTLGARRVDPGIQVKVVWVNAWHDPGRERLAAVTLVNGGADVLLQDTNSTAPLAVAEERGVYAFGWNSDMARFAPKGCLGSVVADWSKYYIDQINQVVAGTWKSGNKDGTIQDGMVDVRSLNTKALPAKALERFNADHQALAQGKLNPFTGPIKDSKGAVRVAAGAQLPVADRDRMDWAVEGVVGSTGV